MSGNYTFLTVLAGMSQPWGYPLGNVSILTIILRYSTVIP